MTDLRHCQTQLKHRLTDCVNEFRPQADVLSADSATGHYPAAEVRRRLRHDSSDVLDPGHNVK